MPRKVLIADDEQHILDTVSAYLRQDGFEVITVRNGRDAVYTFRHEKPDLVILDVMMPEMDGWTAARLIRKESDVPLLFLTARVDETDQLVGLEIGADEYVTKPFSPRVVAARVRALLRRVHGELAGDASLWNVRDLEVNAETRLATMRGRRIDLTPSEFGILQALIARPGACHAYGTARPAAGRGLCGVRAHGRRTRQEPACQDRSRFPQSRIY